MDNYKEQTKVSLKNSEVEISTKKIIPLSDFNLISKIYNNSINKTHYYIETSNEEQFNNIKSILQDSIPYNIYMEEMDKLFVAINNATENKIFLNNPLDSMPLLDILGTFISPIIELVINNSIKDGMYCYNEITGDDIRDLLYYLKDEDKKYFISLYSLFKLIRNGNHASDALEAFKDTIMKKIEHKKEKRTYIMKDTTGYYKIGRSIDPIFRQYQFKTGNITIKLMFYIEGDRELELHHIFASKKIEREWYKLTKNDLKFIRNYNNIRKQHPEYIINNK